MARKPGGRRKRAAPPRDAHFEEAVLDEQVKLSASYFNAIAAGIFTIGAAAPVIAVLLTSTPSVNGVWLVVVGCCTLLSGALHLVGRKLLGKKKQ